MDLVESDISSAARCGVRRRLRLRLGLRLLAAAEGRQRHDDSREGAWRLPSVRGLAAATGVHRNTAAAVYRDLERFGLVRCVHGAGTFAAPPPVHGWAELARQAVCSDPGLAAVLAVELRQPVPVAGPGVPAHRPRFVPLDESPPPDVTVIPVAPLGRALPALCHLPPDSTVRLVSASPRIGRLVWHTIMALHGDAVGLARTADGHPSAAVPGADLELIDLRQFARRGTDVPSEGLFPLRLLVHALPEAG